MNQSTVGSNGDPVVALDRDGNAMIAWERQQGGGGGGGNVDLVARTFDAANAPRSSDFEVPETTGGGQTNAGLDASWDGLFHAVWESNQQGPNTPPTIRMRSFDGFGVPVSGEVQVAGKGSAAAVSATLGSDTVGSSVVIWTFGGHGERDVFGEWHLAPACGAPLDYCSAKTTSSGQTPLIGWSGAPSLTTDGFTLHLASGTPDSHGYLIWGTASEAAPFFGGALCVGGGLQRSDVRTTDGFGAVSLAVPIGLFDVGATRHYQWFFRDSQDAFGFGLTAGLEVTFCN